MLRSLTFLLAIEFDCQFIDVVAVALEYSGLFSAFIFGLDVFKDDTSFSLIVNS